MTIAPRILNLIKPLHDARKKRAEGNREDKAIAPVLREALEALPEGERELWDHEISPPIGVGLEDGGAGRWIDLTALGSADIIEAAMHGLLRLDVGAYEEFAEASTDADLETQRLFIRLSRAVHAGGGSKLVLLPKRNW